MLLLRLAASICMGNNAYIQYMQDTQCCVYYIKTLIVSLELNQNKCAFQHSIKGTGWSTAVVPSLFWAVTPFLSLNVCVIPTRVWFYPINSIEK